MKKRILVPVLILATLVTGSLSFAGPGGCGSCGVGGSCGSKGQGQGAMNDERHEERMDKRMEMMSTVLDLTEAQKTQLEALLAKQWQDTQPLREKMRASREALREIKSADTFNEAEFLAKAIKQAELKTEMMSAKAKIKQQVYALLSPEQQGKADKLADMGRRGKGRHGGFGF